VLYFRYLGSHKSAPVNIPFSLICLWILIAPNFLIAQEIYSNYHVEVIRLDDRVFLLKEHQDYTVNCLVITGDDGLLLMDTGFGELGEYLRDALKSLGKQVKVIINSHVHDNHMIINQLFDKDVLIMAIRIVRMPLHSSDLGCKPQTTIPPLILMEPRYFSFLTPEVIHSAIS